jgi:hypothetical protein
MKAIPAIAMRARRLTVGFLSFLSRSNPHAARLLARVMARRARLAVGACRYLDAVVWAESVADIRASCPSIPARIVRVSYAHRARAITAI